MRTTIDLQLNTDQKDLSKELQTSNDLKKENSIKDNTEVTQETSHIMTGEYVTLMETNGKECESWYYFIRCKDNMEALEHLQQQLEGSSKLSDEEVAKMKADAEINAEADKLEKEKIDVLNQADSLIFQTEKSIKELSDKITEDDKSKIEPLLEELKKAHNDEDIDSIKTLIETVSSTWGEIATRVYQSSEQSEETSEGASTRV